MKLLLDTHFLLWIALDVPRIDAFPWLERYRPWGVSPVSFLELQCLTEAGRLEARTSEFAAAIGQEPRFVVDEVPLVTLIDRGFRFPGPAIPSIGSSPLTARRGAHVSARWIGG